MTDASFIYRLIENIKKFKLESPGVSYIWITKNPNNFINCVDLRLPLNYEHIVDQLSIKMYPIVDNMGQKSYINPEGEVSIVQ